MPKDKNLCSILRRGSCFENKSNTSLDSYHSSASLRRVSFPSDDSELASYLYPEDEELAEMGEFLKFLLKKLKSSMFSFLV